MGKFFVHIYDFFERRRGLFWLTLAVSTGLCLLFALKVHYSEQVTNFFPDDEEGRKQTQVFKNLKVKDQIVMMFTSDDPDRSIECAAVFEEKLLAGIEDGYIRSITSEVGAGEVGQVTGLIYGNLPAYLTAEDYQRLDTLLRPDAIDRKMDRNYATLASPMGMALRDIVLQDPLGMAGERLASLKQLAETSDYEIYGGRIFSPDLSVMLMILEPEHGMGNTGGNEVLISAIEEAARETAREGFETVDISYVGGPSVAVYNARRIKSDTMLTLTIALIIIVAFILVAFRNKWSILLIVTPVVFGGLFALAMIRLIGDGTISAIAIGAGAAVFGIALSYSIHVISHSNHTHDPRQIIRELAYPLTVGSFTTIGAFLGLLFTKSQLLRDFGLFAAMTLVGTTVYCLVFLPHFLRSSGRDNRPGPVLRLIEKINGYPYDRNKWLVGIVLVVTLVCIFFSGKVGFDSDMMNLNYMPKHLAEAEKKLSGFMSGDKSTVLFASIGRDADEAYDAYTRTNSRLDSLKTEGLVEGYSSVRDLIVPPALQQQRIDAWNAYWNDGKKEEMLKSVTAAGIAHGFRENAFGAFFRNMEREYTVTDYTDPEVLPPFLENWVSVSDGLTLFVTQVKVPAEYKDAVYARFESSPEVVIVDRGYYANMMAKTINDDFYLTLFIASFLIFGALLISYGRIELTLLASVPMFVSWIIILGLMALFGIEFNIVNIILSTFIFGIGDDFSIFIMDGLLTEYKNGKKLLAAHKTAIFFSAFTIVVGIGVLIFAKHPALRSISLISILGILTVIVVSYVLQPVLFRIFISSQTRKGGFPYTLGGLLNTLYCFLYFLVGCGLLQGVVFSFLFLPFGGKWKKRWFHGCVSWSTRTFLRTMITTKWIRINETGETFEKPAVIIANHQSFIDILVMLALHPKLIMVTNSWVWKSPVFGRIVRYAGFYHTADGYENLADKLRPQIADGYSVVVFPEGTRSPDMKIGRFHKGAFFLAEKLGLDILPVVLYGNGMISSKRQPFYIKKGFLVSKILERITPENRAYGTTYKERTKHIAAWFRAEYDRVYDEFNRPRNPYFFDALMKNYTYKGPVLEWYMRVKVRMERKYEFFDRIIPREACVVDVGCGYGPLSYMLVLLSDKRRVLGLDYDEEKIALANHSFSRNERISFVAHDALEYDFPPADVFVLNDVLHYLDFPSQDTLLERCLSKVKEGGMVIVRDGDSSDTERHTATRRTEKWSTRLLGFNKTAGQLCFTSTERILALAGRMGFEVGVTDNDKRTSNKIYVIRKR